MERYHCLQIMFTYLHAAAGVTYADDSAAEQLFVGQTNKVTLQVYNKVSPSLLVNLINCTQRC